VFKLGRVLRHVHGEVSICEVLSTWRVYLRLSLCIHSSTSPVCLQLVLFACWLICFTTWSLTGYIMDVSYTDIVLVNGSRRRVHATRSSFYVLLTTMDVDTWRRQGCQNISRARRRQRPPAAAKQFGKLLVMIPGLDSIVVLLERVAQQEDQVEAVAEPRLYTQGVLRAIATTSSKESNLCPEL